MSVPMPVTQPHPTAESPAVRLDVRLGSGKLSSLSISQSEFHIGGAETCDLRLPGVQLPSLIGTIRRTADGASLQRADPAFPVLLNGRILNSDHIQPLRHGDRLAIGPVDATVVIGSHHLRPAFVALNEEPAPDGEDEPTTSDEHWAELERQRAEIADQARELEADRVLWYHRRQAIEAECEQLRAAAMAPHTSADPNLDQVRAELDTIRQQLFEEYQRRRDELVQMQGVVRGASESLNERERQFQAEVQQREQRLSEAEAQLEARFQAALAERLDRQELQWAERRQQLDQELAERRQELETEYALRIPPAVAVKLADRDAEFERREQELRHHQEQHKADLLRLERWQARLEDQQRDQSERAAELDQRHQQLTRDSLEWEEQLGLAQAEQARLISEAARLERQRHDAEQLAQQLAERAAQLDAQQASLAVLRARLDRQHRDAEAEAERLQQDRDRLATAQQELDQKLREAEQRHWELETLQQGTAEQSRQVEERSSLLDATLAELDQQKSALQELETRLTERENALDARSVELAEQTAILTARVNQVIELQQRLEADRALLNSREMTLSEADSARQTFQDQLRRRSEELSARSRHLDEVTQQLTAEKAELERGRAEWSAAQLQQAKSQSTQAEELAEQTKQLHKQATELADREANLARQVERVKEVGRNVAASRRELRQLQEQWAAERDSQGQWQQEREAAFTTLLGQLPELQAQTAHALEQLQAGRDRLRAHLSELHRFAGTARDELVAQRAALRLEAEQLQEREQALEQVRAEQRLQLTEFRQQMLDWQSKVQELRATVNRSESQLASKQAEVSAAAQLAEVAAIEIAQQKEELRQERQIVGERRAEVERQLAEMREWYRRKLRELAKARSAVEPVSSFPFRAEELDPGDRQLGELLLRLDLVDAESLAALWQQAQAQRRTLRHVLLVSGVVTLYQLALIEAGNLDALMLGRFRVIDRVSHTSAETIYRVYDPSRSTEPSRGIYLLRWLSEAELEDPVHPDEYVQRFTMLSERPHEHLHNTLEVLLIQQRPAVVQEWLSGLPGADWPAEITTPGVWLRLLHEVASALAAVHSGDLVHGRLTSSALLLTPRQGLKLLGAGEPDWLHGEPTSPAPSPDQDLRALGQLAFLWLSAASSPTNRPRGRGKAFPDTLQAVLRRLEADPETPMADTVAGAVPYRSAAELVEDLARLRLVFPCPPEAWESLHRQVTESVESPAIPLRRSA